MHLFTELALLSFLYLSHAEADLCFDCVELTMFVENLLINEEDLVDEKLNAKCREQFPQDWSEAVCEQLVKQKLDDMIQGIEDNLAPEQICDKIGLCNLKDFLALISAAPL